MPQLPTPLQFELWARNGAIRSGEERDATGRLESAEGYRGQTELRRQVSQFALPELEADILQLERTKLGPPWCQ